MDEFICEGLDLKEGTYEGKPWKKYILYGYQTNECSFFGNPHAIFEMTYSRSENLLHGHKPEECKGKAFRVFYDKYHKPALIEWDWL